MISALAALAPAVAELLHDALDALGLAHDDPRRSLADQVRAALPARSRTQEALEEAEARRLTALGENDP